MTNSIWSVIITMTTVGYGDVYPKSSVGRFIGVIVALWGLFLVSIFTVTLTNLFSFTSGEQKAFDLSTRLKQKDDLKHSAASLLVSSYKSAHAKKTNNEKLIKQTANTYKQRAIAFFQIAKEVRVADLRNSSD